MAIVSSLYDLPFFRKSDSHFARTFLGGVSMAATLTFESGEKATVLSGIDSNLNGDPAADRTIVNLNGVANTSSLVTPLLRTCTVGLNLDGTCVTPDAQRIVGYLATNPNAQYIQAGLGRWQTLVAIRCSCRRFKIWISRSSRTLPSVKAARKSKSAGISITPSITRNTFPVQSTVWSLSRQRV